jgi:hypothetical protein
MRINKGADPPRAARVVLTEPKNLKSSVVACACVILNAQGGVAAAAADASIPERVPAPEGCQSFEIAATVSSYTTGSPVDQIVRWTITFKAETRAAIEAYQIQGPDGNQHPDFHALDCAVLEALASVGLCARGEIRIDPAEIKDVDMQLEVPGSCRP